MGSPGSTEVVGAPPVSASGGRKPEHTGDEILDYYRTLAPYIDRELATRPDRRFWTDSAERHRGERVLELGCGTGRVTELLLPAAHGLVGVDVSPAMLARARRRLAGTPGLQLVRADVRRLPLAGGFHLAVAADGLFSHLLADRERELAIREIAGQLTGGGVFLLDGLWLSRERRRDAASGDGWRREWIAEDDGPALQIREHWRCEPDGRLCRIRYAYREEDGTETVARFTARYWEVEEATRRLRRAGFRVSDVWGDFDRSPWDPDRSRRLIVRGVRR